MKNFFSKKWVKISLPIVIAIIILIIIFGSKTNEIYRTTFVKRGDIEVSISGSGTIVASESRTEISKVSSKVKEVNYKEGDFVKTGDIIATLDDTDYKVTVESQKLAIKQAELNKANIDRQVSNLIVKAPTNGYISNLNIKENTFISSNSQVCNVTKSNKYEITLQFVAGDTNKVLLGSKANIILTDTLNYISGEVTFVGENKYIVDGGVLVVDVIITAEHSTYSLNGIRAKADVQTTAGNTISSVNQSSFREAESINILTKTMGTVSKIHVKNGQYVNKGDAILELENTDLKLSAETTKLSIENAKMQLKYAEDKLNDYKIISPIDGKITKFDLKVGDQVTMGSILTIVSNEGKFEFEIPVDELDIAKINYDSEVEVTIDAIPETVQNPLKGKIIKMPLQGVTTGGVTDYYVTIEIDGNENVRLSMNANAKITVNEVKNVLYVPIEAINTEDGETYVKVKNGDTIQNKKVTTGMSDVSYIEIKEGLLEGEEVVVPTLGTGFGLVMGG